MVEAGYLYMGDIIMVLFLYVWISWGKKKKT